MNRRKFLQSSTLAAISTLVLHNKLQAFNSSNRHTSHLLIDLGAVRFQDVISNPEQSAMPQLLKLISSEQMILNTTDVATSNKELIPVSLNNTRSFELNALDGGSFNPDAEFYDTYLLKKAVEFILHSSQNLYVRIHQTEIAHYNIPAYRLLLSQADELISKNFRQLTQSGIQVHVYSSSGRNLQPDEYGGLHHHAQDINCAKTFYIRSNTTW